jgi:S1-C subfamily serine protease
MTPERHAVVVDVQVHPHHDLAVVTTDHTVQPLSPVNGLALREPTWADPVLLLGYPFIPTAGETPMTVQLGEVVTPSVRTYNDEENLFLYSAIARPGNSGGPIIATDGRLVGLVTEELFEKPDDESPRAPASPFYAGLPASVIRSGLVDLGHSDLLAFDT